MRVDNLISWSTSYSQFRIASKNVANRDPRSSKAHWHPKGEHQLSSIPLFQSMPASLPVSLLK
jgi:hypothetical protein